MIEWSTGTANGNEWYITTDTQLWTDTETQPASGFLIHHDTEKLERFKDFLKMFNENIRLKNEPFLKDRKNHLAEIEELFEI